MPWASVCGRWENFEWRANLFVTVAVNELQESFISMEITTGISRRPGLNGQTMTEGKPFVPVRELKRLQKKPARHAWSFLSRSVNGEGNSVDSGKCEVLRPVSRRRHVLVA